MQPDIYRDGTEIREQLSHGVPDGKSARSRLWAKCATVEIADRICRLLRADVSQQPQN